MNERWKPTWLSIASIINMTYWARLLLNAYNMKHNTIYGGTVTLYDNVHMYHSNSQLTH